MAMSREARKRISEGMRRRHQERRQSLVEELPDVALMDRPSSGEPSTHPLQLFPLTGEDVSLLVDVVTRAAQRQIEFIQAPEDVQQGQHLMNLKLRLLQIASTL